MTDDVALLQLMMADNEKQDSIYLPGPYWRRRAAVSARKMIHDGLGNFRSNQSGLLSLGFTDTELLDPAILDDLGTGMKKWIRKLVHAVCSVFFAQYRSIVRTYFQDRNRYWGYYINSRIQAVCPDVWKKYSLPDTLVGGCDPDLVMNVEGKAVSRFYLEHLSRIMNFASVIDFFNVRSFFEIGGGFGCTTHLMKHLFPSINKIVYLDIVPMLYIGTQYLKHFFGTQVSDYRILKQKPEIAFSQDQSFELFPVAPWDMERLAMSNVDLFWNSASFQEMPYKVFLNYARHITTFCKKKGSLLCLIFYPNGAEDTLKPDQILESFSTAFDMKRIEPVLNLHLGEPFQYYYGISRETNLRVSYAGNLHV